MEFIVGGLIRSLCGFVVKAVYVIAEAIYGLFFAVSKVELFSGTVVVDLFKRLQLIIGVFVLFQLAVTIIKGIIDPNTFTDSKSGAGNLVKRVIIALLILTLVVPFNINTSSNNSYFLKVKEHGILFGTLYSLQNRILDNNTIGKLIFGGDIDDENQLLIPTNTTQTTIGNNGTQIVNTDTVEKAQTSFRKNLSVGVVRAFFAFNPNTESCNRLDYRGGKVSGKKLKSIHQEAKSVDEITDMVTIHCKVNGKEEWVIDYTPFLSGIMGIALVVLFFSFMFDVVVRAAKLAILRLLAPIPIISYINPNGKDNAFDSWSKLLVSTYIDLFVRLATIYLMLFIASKLLLNLRLSPQESGIINFFATCVVIIGLLIFAKQAPKFIRDVLGLKGDSGSLFGGLTGAIGVGGTAWAVSRGAVDSFSTARSATQMADRQNNPATADAWYNRGKQVLAGVGGALAGTGTGLCAAFTAKDHSNRAAADAIRKRNENVWKKPEEDLKYAESVNAYRKAIMDRASSEGIKSDETTGTLSNLGGNLTMYNGLQANAHDFNSWYDSALNAGNNYKKYTDGTTVITQAQYDLLSPAARATFNVEGTYSNYRGTEINLSDAAIIKEKVEEANIANYADRALLPSTDPNHIVDNTIAGARENFRTAAKHDVETTFSEIKKQFGAEKGRIDKARTDINSSKQDHLN